jgi:site-specific recombinase XerD
MVAFGKETSQAIWRYLRKNPREADDYLFTGERGYPLNRDSLRKVFARLGKVAGVTGVHPHRFRHDCAVRLLRNGAYVFGAQSLLGHSRIGVTERYVKAAEADVRAMHRIASPIDNLKGVRR